MNKILTINNLLSMQKKMLSEIKTSLIDSNIQEIQRGKNLLIIKAVERIIKNFLLFEIKDIKRGNQIIIKSLDSPAYTPPTALNMSNKNIKVNLRGVIDRVDLYNNTYRIIDYKTGYFEPREIQCMDLSELKTKPKILQLLLYAILFHKNHYNTQAPITAGIIHLRTNNFTFHPCSVNKNIHIDEMLLEDFESELEKIALELANPRIPFVGHSNTDDCRFCN